MKHAVLICIGWLFLVSAAMAQPAMQPTFCRDGLDKLNQRDYRTAIQQLTQCLTLDMPSSVRAFILQSRARSYASQNRIMEAIADQKASLETDKPYDVWPHIMLAVYHRSFKQYKEALDASTQAQAYDEDGPRSGPGMAVFYHTGLTLHAMGRYREAIEAFDKGIPKQPAYGHAVFARGLSYEALADRTKAREDFLKAGELVTPAEYTPFMLAKFKEYGVPLKTAAR